MKLTPIDVPDREELSQDQEGRRAFLRQAVATIAALTGGGVLAACAEGELAEPDATQDVIPESLDPPEELKEIYRLAEEYKKVEGERTKALIQLINEVEREFVAEHGEIIHPDNVEPELREIARANYEENWRRIRTIIFTVENSDSDRGSNMGELKQHAKAIQQRLRSEISQIENPDHLIELVFSRDTEFFEKRAAVMNSRFPEEAFLEMLQYSQDQPEALVTSYGISVLLGNKLGHSLHYRKNCPDIKLIEEFVRRGGDCGVLDISEAIGAHSESSPETLHQCAKEVTNSLPSEHGLSRVEIDTIRALLSHQNTSAATIAHLLVILPDETPEDIIQLALDHPNNPVSVCLP